MAVDNIGVDVPMKFGDSRSNGFPDIRGADFVSNELTNIGEACHNRAKRKRCYDCLLHLVGKSLSSVSNGVQYSIDPLTWYVNLRFNQRNHKILF